MSQSLAKNTIHLVFSTKNRRPDLNESVQVRLFPYLAGIFSKWESPAIVIGGHDDHVHALFTLSKNHALAKLVEEVKKGSSKWLKSVEPTLSGFSWQSGYGAFSVSESSIASVRAYIEQQAEHHCRISFQDEVRTLLARTDSRSTSDIFGRDVSPLQGSIVHTVAVFPGRCPGLACFTPTA